MKTNFILVAASLFCNMLLVCCGSSIEPNTVISDGNRSAELAPAGWTLTVADSLLNEGNFDEALSIYQRLRNESVQNPMADGIHELDYKIIETLIFKEENREALLKVQTSLESIPNLAHNDSCRLLLLQGRAFRGLDSLNLAEQAWLHSLHVSKQNGLIGRQTESMMRLGRLYIKLGEYEKGITILEETSGLLTTCTTCDPNISIGVNSFMALEYANRQDFGAAKTYALRAEEAFNRDEKRISAPYRMVYYANIGTYFGLVAKYKRCFELLNKGVLLAKKLKDEVNEQNCIYNLAYNHQMYGNPELSIQYCRLLLNASDPDEIQHDFPAQRDLAGVHTIVGQCFESLHQADSQFVHFNRVLEIYKNTEGGKGDRLASIYGNFAWHYLRKDPIEWENVIVSVDSMELALADCPECYTSYLFTLTFDPLRSLAKIQLGSGEEELKSCERSLGLFGYSANNVSGIDWENQPYPLELMKSLDMYTSAIEAILMRKDDPKLLDLGISMLNAIKTGTTKFVESSDIGSSLAFISESKGVLERSIALHCRQPSPDVILAFELFEEAKAKMLKSQVESITLRYGDSKSELLQIDSLREIKMELEAIQSNDAVHIEELLKLNSKIDSLTEVVDSRTVPHMQHGDASRTLNDIQSTLLTNEAVISYVVTNDNVYALTITKDRALLNSCPEWSKNKSEFQEFERSIRSDDSDPNFYTSAHKFYNLLVANNLPRDFKLEKLVVVPDEELNSIPFESLVVKEGGARSTFLIDEMEVRYEYALALLLNKQKQRSDESEVLAFAPGFLNSTLSGHTKAGLTPLPGAIAEVKYITSNWRGKKFLEDDATEESVKRHFHDYEVLHFGTHAFACMENAALSGIVMHRRDLTAPISGVDYTYLKADSLNAEDNVLYAYEIQNMKINADLVVLSACESNIGKLQRGEGSMSLSRAFKYAGCNNVVSTLWKVDDNSTSEIIELFYDNLGAGLGKSESLAKAKREYRTNHPEDSPYFWAGIVLIGDNEPVHLKKKSGWAWYLAGGSLMLILGLKRYRQRKFSGRPAHSN